MIKKRLGEMLLEAGVIDEAQLRAALGHQRKWGGKLGQALLDLKFAQESQIVAALSQKLGYEVVSVTNLPRTPAVEAALKLVPKDLAAKHTLLPIACDQGSITIAMADPSNISVVDELSFRTGKRVRIVLAGDRELAGAVRRLYFGDDIPVPSEPVSLPMVEVKSGGSGPPLTRDPFEAMPDYIREGYFHRPTQPIVRPESPPTAPPPPRTVTRSMPRPGIPPASPTMPGMPAPTVSSPGFANPSPQGLAGSPPELVPILQPDPPLPGPMAGVPGQPPGGQPGSALLDAIDRMGRGEAGPLRPEQLVAALARLLLRRGLVTEAELLTELNRRD